VNLPDFPKPLARLVAALPAYPASRAFVALGNLIAWPGLRDQDWTDVIGQPLCVQVQDLGLRVDFSLGPDGFRAEAHGNPATTFTATARDLARLALRLEDPDTLFFDRRLRIEGNTDLGLRVKNMLDAVEIETAAAAMPLRLGPLVLRLREWAMT
jgi:predicted lipid carrier protein YhbT